MFMYSSFMYAMSLKTNLFYSHPSGWQGTVLACFIDELEVIGQGMRIRNQAIPVPTAWEPYMWQQHLVRKHLLFGSLCDAARLEDRMNVYVDCNSGLISRALKLTSRFTPLCLVPT